VCVCVCVCVCVRICVCGVCQTAFAHSGESGGPKTPQKIVEQMFDHIRLTSSGEVLTMASGTVVNRSRRDSVIPTPVSTACISCAPSRTATRLRFDRRATSLRLATVVQLPSGAAVESLQLRSSCDYYLSHLRIQPSRADSRGRGTGSPAENSDLNSPTPTEVHHAGSLRQFCAISRQVFCTLS